MDWLVKSKATIECHSGNIKFKDDCNQEANIFCHQGNPSLYLISATKLLKHYRKNHMVYAVKLNPVDKPSVGNEPEWLSDYEDIFPEELT